MQIFESTPVSYLEPYYRVKELTNVSCVLFCGVLFDECLDSPYKTVNNVVGHGKLVA